MALAAAHAAVDALLAGFAQGGLAGCSDAGLVAVLRSLESLSIKVVAARHQPILEIETRGVPTAGGARTTSGFLAQLLRIDTGEAHARVHAARVCGRRTTLSGQILEPLLPLVARGQVEGVVSLRAQQIIATCVAKLPVEDQEEWAAPIEAQLVDLARTHAPKQLAYLAARINYLHDQDGALDDVEHRRRHRGVSVHRRADGSCHGSFEGTAQLAELLEVAFDATAKPKPEADGVKDPRTPPQRRHDALIDVLTMLVRAGQLPDAGGVSSTIVLTMSIADYEARTGFALTGHGTQIPVTEALSWSGSDAKIMAVVLNKVRAIVAYGTSHRLFHEHERLAMAARDGGCAFPDCDAPPGWCQAHHVTEWRTSKRTSVDDGILLCGYHHREFERLGFTVTMHNGIPVWTTPHRW